MKRFLLALTIPAALILSGCSSSPAETDPKPSATSTFNALDGLALPTETSAAKVTTPTVPMAPPSTTTKAPVTKAQSQGIYGVTPEGLTTAVNVPVLASAAEMKQGCVEAKSALDMFGGDLEVVLALMQATAEDSTEEVTFAEGENRWADSAPAEQAAIIQALHAAADGEC